MSERRQCVWPGCSRGPFDEHGSALYRISPKGPGQKFVGLCGEHVKRTDYEVDEDVLRITSAIEASNRGQNEA